MCNGYYIITSKPLRQALFNNNFRRQRGRSQSGQIPYIYDSITAGWMRAL